MKPVFATDFVTLPDPRVLEPARDHLHKSRGIPDERGDTINIGPD